MGTLLHVAVEERAEQIPVHRRQLAEMIVRLSPGECPKRIEIFASAEGVVTKQFTHLMESGEDLESPEIGYAIPPESP